MVKPSEATSSSSSPAPTSSSLAGGTMDILEPKYKGVRKRKWGKWVSEIRLPNSRERIWLGSFDSPEKAARAFDAALYCLRGGGAKFNFPDNPPEIEGGESLGPQEIQVVAARYANEEPPRREITPQISRGIMEQYMSSSSDGGAKQIESNSDQGGAIDWSFLNMLEGGGSDFGLHYSIGLDNMVTDNDAYFAAPQPLPPPPSPPLIDGFVEDDNNGHHDDDQPYSQQSFLWNF